MLEFEGHPINVARDAYKRVDYEVYKEFDKVEQTAFHSKITALQELRPVLTEANLKPILLSHFFVRRDCEFISPRQLNPGNLYRYLVPADIAIYQFLVLNVGHDHIQDSEELRPDLNDGIPAPYDVEEFRKPKYQVNFERWEIKNLLESFNLQLQQHPLVVKIMGELSRLDVEMKTSTDQIAERSLPTIRQRLLNLKRTIQNEKSTGVYPKQIPISAEDGNSYWLLRDEDRLVAAQLKPCLFGLLGSKPDFKQVRDLDPKTWVYGRKEIYRALTDPINPFNSRFYKKIISQSIKDL